MLQKILSQLEASQTTLVAVSKTQANSQILKMYEAGQRVFGENRVQELMQKYEELPKDIEWHLIGHLQSNKVKYIAPFVSLIHSVDKLALLLEIDKQAQKNGRVQDVLLQFHIAEEDSKFGLTWEKAQVLLESEAYAKMKCVQVLGVMGMASFTSDKEQVRAEFRQLKEYFNQLKSQYFADAAHFKEISMGMSGDYPIAITEGSTMVRIGSLLFGAGA